MVAIIVCGLVWRSVNVRRPSETVETLAPATTRTSPAAYVGDAKCAECHPRHSASYRDHPMGRSLAPIADATPIERFDAAAQHPFRSGPFEYSVRRDGDRVIHRESRRLSGDEAIDHDVEVHYAVGSGRHGRSYLIDRGGWFYMSPLTWYPRKGVWDLSPGYEVNNSHFSRPVTAACLFCHTNRVTEVPDLVNRFREPLFDGHAIGCERCHGPGEEHVALRERHDKAVESDPIVNPRRLSPVLREAVCEQCHLSGALRVLRRGRETFDFRPGQPLSDYLAVFVKANPKPGEHKFVGHVEQMYASRCFQRSEGRLGCISCHDPHAVPPADDREYFRRRCLECHGESACLAPSADRAATQPADNCITCHMPPLASEIRHTATTDHRIPRRPDSDSSIDARDDLPLRDFYRGPLKPSDAEAERDLGLAILVATSVKPELIAQKHVALAHDLLQAATARDPTDVPALEAFGHAQWWRGQRESALRTFERVLELAPQREFVLDSLASRSQASGRHDQAVAFWERAAAVSPWQIKTQLGLALAYAHQHNWPACHASSLRAREIEPANPGAQQLLVESLLGLTRFDEAATEFHRLLKLNPSQAATLQKWFDEHPLRQR